MGHELGQTPTFGIATFTAVTGYFFNALFFIFGGHVSNFIRSAVKRPFLRRLRVGANSLLGIGTFTAVTGHIFDAACAIVVEMCL